MDGAAGRMIRVKNVELYCESFGQAGDPAVLLIMGNSAPGLVWPDDFCWRLASASFRVIRFDQRDTGLATYVDFAAAPYDLDDMTADALELMDELAIDQAHIVGLSQGGALAYRLALAWPDRCASLSVIMSSTDLRPKTDAFAGAPPRADELPRPSADYVAAVIALNAAPAETIEAKARRFVDNFRLAKGPKSPFDEAAWLALGRAFAEWPRLRRDGRAAAIANNGNHVKAQAASPPLLVEHLGSLKPPVLIIHGGGDPIFPIEHARWAARAIPGARLLEISDLGHALDPAFFAPIATELTTFWRSRR